MSQALNLGRLLSRSKYESQHKNHEVKNCGKNCVSCPYLLKASLYQFKRDKKTFYHSSNLIILLFAKDAKKNRRKGLSRERVNKYLQTTYKTAAISTIGS